MKNYYLILITLGFIGCSTDALEEYNEKTMEENKINSDVEVITVEAVAVDPEEWVEVGEALYYEIPIENLHMSMKREIFRMSNENLSFSHDGSKLTYSKKKDGISYGKLILK